MTMSKAHTHTFQSQEFRRYVQISISRAREGNTSHCRVQSPDATWARKISLNETAYPFRHSGGRRRPLLSRDDKRGPLSTPASFPTQGRLYEDGKRGRVKCVTCRKKLFRAKERKKTGSGARLSSSNLRPPLHCIEL